MESNPQKSKRINVMEYETLETAIRELWATRKVDIIEQTVQMLKSKDMNPDIIKQFQDEVSKIDTHYLNACQDVKCERTVIGTIFEKYLKQEKETLMKEMLADCDKYENNDGRLLVEGFIMRLSR